MKRTRSKAVARTAWFAVYSGAIMAAAACAAVLGIDDRELIAGGTGSEGGTDSPTGDGSTDAPIGDSAFESSLGDGGLGDAAGNVCIKATCEAAGGTCSANTCTFACSATSCNMKTVVCPDGNDCVLECTVANGCDTVKCAGGLSCTLLCTGATTCKNVSCESQRCDFECLGDSCKASPVTCDAGICIANCAGNKSCDKGVDFRATEFCGIKCSGSPSCSAGGAPVRCNAPDASIECTNAANTCQMGKPQCFPGPTGHCSISCGTITSSCGADYCCDSGVSGTGCSYTSGTARPNTCP